MFKQTQKVLIALMMSVLLMSSNALAFHKMVNQILKKQTGQVIKMKRKFMKINSKKTIVHLKPKVEL